jgi:hypothetical protein
MMETTRLCRAAALAALLAAPAAAQEGWTQRAFRYEYQLIGEYERHWNERREESRLNPRNVAELRAIGDELRAYPAGEVSFGPFKARADLKIDWRPYGNTMRDSSAVAYGEVQELRAAVGLGDAAYLVAGRQRLGWGTGIVWNPTRVEPQKDPFRLGNRLRGADVVRFEYVHAAATANLLFFPAQFSQPSAFAARLETSVAGVAGSASVVAPGTGRWRVGYDASAALDRLTLYVEGAARARSLRPMLDSLGAQRARPDARDLAGLYHDVVAGSLLSPSARTQFVVEYRYQSDFSTALEDDVFVTHLPRNAELYDPLGRGRHRVYVNGRYGLPGRSGVSLGAFLDPATHQSILVPGTGWSRASYRLDVQAFVFRERHDVSVFRSTVQCILSAYY